MMQGSTGENKIASPEILGSGLETVEVLKGAVYEMPDEEIFSEPKVHNMRFDGAPGAVISPGPEEMTAMTWSSPASETVTSVSLSSEKAVMMKQIRSTATKAAPMVLRTSNAAQISATMLKMIELCTEAIHHIPVEKICAELRRNKNSDDAARVIVTPALTLLRRVPMPIGPRVSVNAASIPVSTFEQLAPSSTPGGLSPRTFLWGTKIKGPFYNYEIDFLRIHLGEDTRTTLMMKSIPNEYNYLMPLAEINKTQRGLYDYVYLPIDNKTNRNKGYAFINLISPTRVISFYEAFNEKKWEASASKKVVSLAYARIQGKAAMVRHFKNLDQRFRPKFFDSNGQETGDQGTSSS